jgi:2-polyprenyl-3-methyl-5-hydroxy-6-metoxy-1,4-benzoquinol methylase
MDYREVLYGTYVSANKRRVYQRLDARASRKNVRNLAWSLRGWLPAAQTQPRVLDLGCGAGNLLSLFEFLGYSDFTGVDNSAEQVAEARERFPAVIQADVFEFLTEETGEPYDVITAFDLLEHLTRDEAITFLRLVSRRMRPGGSLILQLPNGDSPFAGAVFWSDLTHETPYTAISLRHVLEACGFDDCTFREHRPTPLSIRGFGRSVLWQLLRSGIKAVHYIETGTPSTGVYTRTFRCRAIKPLQQS